MKKTVELHAKQSDYYNSVISIADDYGLTSPRELLILALAYNRYGAKILRSKIEEAKRLSWCCGYELLASLAMVCSPPNDPCLYYLAQDPGLQDRDPNEFSIDLKLGSRNELVRQARTFLESMKFLQQDSADPFLFDKDLRGAVICFQECSHIPRTGEIDDRVWRAMIDSYFFLPSSDDETAVS